MKSVIPLRPFVPSKTEVRLKGVSSPESLTIDAKSTLAHTFGLAALGGLLLWLAFPPLGLWPLAWIAPVPWLWLIGRPTGLSRKDYGAIWLASFLFWAVLLQGIRLAHPALYGGWLVLSGYLGIYLAAFVLLGRWLVHQATWPLAVAAPLVWVAMEVTRGYVATGFAIGFLSQTQVAAPCCCKRPTW